MHQIEEILRLDAAQLSQPQIARALCLSLGVINKYLQAARRAKLSWPLPSELTAEQLQQRLFPAAENLTLLPKITPDFANVHQEVATDGACSSAKILPSCFQAIADSSGTGIIPK